MFKIAMAVPTRLTCKLLKTPDKHSSSEFKKKVDKRRKNPPRKPEELPTKWQLTKILKSLLKIFD
jgi:hypothetical protein